MRHRALEFLQSEMEGPGLWRYWASRDERRASLPPDLDDICCVSHALKSNHRDVPANARLVLANRDPGGLFYTWLLPRPGVGRRERRLIDQLVRPEQILFAILWRFTTNVDCAVNANVVRYLGENAQTRRASRFIVRALARGEESYQSDYYPDPMVCYYMVSRAFAAGVVSLGRAASAVTRRILEGQQDSGSFGSALRTAVAICTVLNFGGTYARMQRPADHLLETQRGDGSWPAAPMFLAATLYCGSEEMTTALCLEALARFDGG